MTPSERISATQKLPEITAQLLKELKRDGVDIDNARKVSDARDLAPDENDIAEILQTPENERRWCPATRVAEQRESAALRDEQVRVGAFQNPPHRPFTCAVWSVVTANVLPPR